VWLEKNDAYIDGTVSRLPVYAADPDDYMEITVIDENTDLYAYGLFSQPRSLSKLTVGSKPFRLCDKDRFHPTSSLYHQGGVRAFKLNHLPGSGLE
jgi:hypothetical protein